MRDRIQYYMQMANLVAKRSTCARARVGAVLTNHNRVVGTGYNGSPRGAKHCTERRIDFFSDVCGCLTDEQGRCAMSIHAEVNAILSREGFYSPSDDLTIYCTHQPCRHCIKIIAQAGIKEVYYGKQYPDEIRDQVAAEIGIKMTEIF